MKKRENAEFVEFYGDRLHVFTDEAGRRWVALKPICKSLNLAWQVQHRRLLEDARFHHHHMVTVDARGRDYEMFCVPIDQVNGWLYTINSRKVKASSRERLLKYQEECQEVLFKHFMPNGGTNAEVATILGKIGAVLEAHEKEMKLNRAEIQYQGSRADEAERSVRLMEAACSIFLTKEERVEIQKELELTAKVRGVSCDAVAEETRIVYVTGGSISKNTAKRVINILRTMRGDGIKLAR